MPLPQPNFDDKNFDALVEESMKLIPRHAPEWTDHNRHDPGITLLELFAWLTEMQQFYLNSVGLESYLKFLKLLDTKRQDATPARTEINFRVSGTSTLGAGITAGATSLTVAAGDGAKFPTAPFNATIWNKTDYPDPSDDPQAEDVRITTVVADTFRVARGQKGTAAVAHNTAGKTYGIILGTGSVLIPRHTKLMTQSLEADRQLIFETGSALRVLSIELKRILASTRRGLKDNTGANDWDGLSYFAFGEEAEAESRLYLGFDRAFPAGEQIVLTFDLIEDYAVTRGRHGLEEMLPLPSALVTWEYYNTAGKWAPLEIVATIEALVSELENNQAGRCFGSFDKLLSSIESSPAFVNLGEVAQNLLRQAITEAGSLQDIRGSLFDPQFLIAKGDGTLMLSQSGRLFFNAPSDMRRYEDPPFNDELLFWVRATVRQAGYELPPQVDSISLNTIDAFQRDTVAEAISFSGSGEPNQSVQANSYLAIYGAGFVQVCERDGRWKDWVARENFNSSGPNDLHYVIERHPAAGAPTITFGDGMRGRMPRKGENQIRYVSYLPEFEDERKLGRSNGLPGQTFTLDRKNVIAEPLTIQIEERVVLPWILTETTDVSCFLSFGRTTEVKSDQTVQVRVVIKAKEDLCNVSVQENLRGEIKLASNAPEPGESPPKVPDEPTLIFEAGRMRPGATREWQYTLTSAAGGGSISGQISIAMGRNCPPIGEVSPTSIIEIGTSSEDLRWRDWIRVDDFDASGPGDPHFVFDASVGAIGFGDGINGEVPQAGAGDRNIRIVSLQTCEGENGNVAPESIGNFTNPGSVNLPGDLLSLRLSQVGAASGGRSSETIGDAQVRAREDLRTPYQAVSSTDFEFLALHTPGLRVARAKAIPLFSARNKPDPRSTVTVVILPYSLSAKPVPSENFLRTVCCHLNRHRLITTQVETIAPNYVQVSVQATLLLQGGFDIEAARSAIIRSLNRFLRPIPEVGDTLNEGWPFGRTVYKSEIYQLIENVDGVDCVENVALTAQGSGANRDENGNITVTPSSVVYSGEHQVEVVAPQLECRRLT
jgi:hypothetical protein